MQQNNQLQDLLNAAAEVDSCLCWHACAVAMIDVEHVRCDGVADSELVNFQRVSNAQAA